jgi:hypothetical protein
MSGTPQAAELGYRAQIYGDLGIRQHLPGEADALLGGEQAKISSHTFENFRRFVLGSRIGLECTGLDEDTLNARVDIALERRPTGQLFPEFVPKGLRKRIEVNRDTLLRVARSDMTPDQDSNDELQAA